MTWREISVERLLTLRDALVIDVRSPCEHAVERIPGSTNIPLLSDQERKIVGTLYAEQGDVAARILALKIISPKIPQIVDSILGLRHGGGSVVIHCWRGGLRSEAVASFLTVVGVDCWRLTGGYKAWRKFVLNDFARDKYEFTGVVLHGRTGTGKTEILKQLRQRQMQVIDLEELCHHRGSVFGGLGLAQQPTQKNFEGVLWQTMRTLSHSPVFLEAESRKVGKLAVPDFLLRRMESSRRILVTGSLEKRIERLVGEYALMTSEDGECALQSLELLKERLGKANVARIRELFDQGKLKEVVEILFVCYYDPLYDRHISKYQPYDLTVDGDSSEVAASAISSWVSEQTKLISSSAEGPGNSAVTISIDR
jgi:tRNA 2-selenouridine synthase